jgi:hypothetical protein
MPVKHRILGTALSLGLLVGGGGVFASQLPEYDHITDEMAEIRELELLEPLDIQVKSRAELQDWLEGALAEYTEDMQAIDERVLVAFGFVEPGTDLGDLESSILGEQIAGFYDPETQEMVVVLSGEDAELTANDQVTFAHEVVHALQDQHFDLMAVQGDLETISGDQSLAVTAMIEGDATVAQVMYMVDKPGLLDAVNEELQEYESPSLDSAPLYYSESLLFPYEDGALFVIAIQGEGGWEAVDAMYETPPTTTEQILHPEKYLEGEGAVAVEADDPLTRLGDGWQVFDDDSMGEFMTDVFLRNGGARNRDARHASEGWGGDNYIVFGNDEETGLTWRSAWDTDDDADEFFEVLVETETERLDAEVEEQTGSNHIRIIGDGYIGEVMLDGDTVTYTLTENVDTLNIVLGVSVADE